MRKALQLGLHILIATIALSGCGPQGGGLALKIYFTQPAAPGGASLRGGDPIQEGQTPPDITDFRICVSAADMGKPKCEQFNLNDYEKKKKARIDGLPVGKDRKVTFQGYNFANYEVHWCGEVQGIAIKKDQTTKVSMFISGCSDFTGVRNQMGFRRVFHTATKLPDGRVLIAGGFCEAGAVDGLCPGGLCVHLTATRSVDIYSPLTGSFDSVSGLELNHPRGLHTATLLPDGRIFIAGGCEKALWRADFPDGPAEVIEVDDGGWGTAGSSAEIIDPLAGTVEDLAEPLPTSRAFHRDTLLPNGEVLLLGGMGPAGNQALDSAVRYSVSSGTFEETDHAMDVPRQGMLVIPWGSDSFLLWGGNHPPAAGAGTFAEILKAENNEFYLQVPAFVTNEASLGLPSFYSAGVRLQSGQILVTGGALTDLAMFGNLTEPRVLRNYRRLDMNSETITQPEDPAVTMAGHMFAFHTATLLKNNRVLVAGGVTSVHTLNWFCDPQEKALFYYPEKEEDAAFVTEQIGGNSVVLCEPRAGHTATELDDGTVLLVGGFNGKGTVGISDTAEVYNPASRELSVR
jgi:hypothetical protein